MAVFSQHHATEGQVRCPTCNARQDWSDACRRCQCDLTFLRSAMDACRRSRRRALWHLRAGRLSEALRHARRACTLAPDQRSTRLLAVCYLLSGNWTQAILVARMVADET